MILKVTLIGLLAGVLGTGAGGILSSIFRREVDRYLNFCMGLSGGIMLAVVVFDLMKESMDSSGVLFTVLFTFIGVLLTMFIKSRLDFTGEMQSGYLIFISILLHNIPEGLATALSLAGARVSTKKIILFTFIAGIPMGIGSFLGVYFAGLFKSLIGLFLSLAAGTMLFVVLDEIMPKSKSLYSIIGFLTGTIIVYCI